MAGFDRILRSLRGGGPQARVDTLWVLGDGRFGIDVVGESNYQEELEEIAGGRRRHGVDLEITARLRPEDENPHDPQAVAVEIDGRKVGYLSRADARLFRRQAGELITAEARILCRGRIRGGWDRGPGDRGHFGVRLDAAR